MERPPKRGVRPLIVGAAAAAAVLLAAPLALTHPAPGAGPPVTDTSSARVTPALFRGVTPAIAALHQLPPSFQSRGVG